MISCDFAGQEFAWTQLVLLQLHVVLATPWWCSGGGWVTMGVRQRDLSSMAGPILEMAERLGSGKAVKHHANANGRQFQHANLRGATLLRGKLAFPRVSIPGDPRKSLKTSCGLALNILKHLVCHILFIWGDTKSSKNSTRRR